MREKTTEKNASQEWALKNKMILEGSREMSPEEGGVHLGTGCERIFRGGRLDGRILKSWRRARMGKPGKSKQSA